MKRGMTLAAVLFVTAFVLCGTAAAEVEENPFAPETKGEFTGIVKEKGESWIRVRSEMPERSVRFVPEWTGGLPQNGGGYNKMIVKAIKEAKVGAQVRISWKFEEHPRALKITVLNADGEKPAEQ